MQIESTMSYHLIHVRVAIINTSINSKCWQGCGDKGTLVHCWSKCRLVQLFYKTLWSYLKKFKMKLPYNPAVLLLRIYRRKHKTLIWKTICNPVFTEVLFTTPKLCRQPKCPLMDEWIQKLCYLYNEILLGHIKEQNLIICNMDGHSGYYAN